MLSVFPIGSKVFDKFKNHFLYLQYYEGIKKHFKPLLNSKRCHLYDPSTFKGHFYASGWCHY